MGIDSQPGFRENYLFLGESHLRNNTVIETPTYRWRMRYGWGDHLTDRGKPSVRESSAFFSAPFSSLTGRLSMDFEWDQKKETSTTYHHSRP